MSPDQMRQKILMVYPSPNWEDRIYKMSDIQVAAIYNRLLNQGKIR